MAKFILSYTRTVKNFIETEVEASSVEEVLKMYEEGQTENHVVDSDIMDEYDVVVQPKGTSDG